jgi:hypothetical protein
MSDVLTQLADAYDIVVLDAPPLLTVADAGELAPLVDGVLLCVRWGATRREQLVRGRELLDRVGARTFGALLTFVPRRVASTDDHAYSDLRREQPRRWPWRRKHDLARDEALHLQVLGDRLRPADRTRRDAGPDARLRPAVRPAPKGPGAAADDDGPPSMSAGVQEASARRRR